MNWIWDFEHCVTLGGIIFFVAVAVGYVLIVKLFEKRRDIIKELYRIKSKWLFMESTMDNLAGEDYDHNFKIRSLNNRMEDITNRVREVEIAIFEVRDDSK